MKFLLAQKLGMTQVYGEGGSVTPVTVLSCPKNIVTQIRTKEKDGYSAVQVGAGVKKKISKPQAGHFKDLGKFRWVCEYAGAAEGLKRADTVEASVFAEGDSVSVTAVSKGKGFAGVVKRHRFAGGPASHGHPHNHRAPGSIGCRFPQHVHKGKRMAGHMGHETVTIRNLKIVKVDAERNLLAVKGAIPGGRGTLVKVVGMTT